MKIVKRKDAFYVVPDVRTATAEPLAGPFERRASAGWWIVEQVEQTLTRPEQKDLWGKVLQAMGGVHTDPFHAWFVCDAIARDVKADLVWKYAVGYRREVEDVKRRAAGDRHVA